MGTAFGGFGFSIFGDGRSVTAFPVQPVSIAAKQIATTPLLVRQELKRKERRRKGETSPEKLRTVSSTLFL
jgi:hypothetical protein